MRKLLLGDCIARMAELPAGVADSLVTDPPAGISFMGKEWDANKGGRREWVAWLTQVVTESMRVMKPGAHGLVWALPRTSHWTATALEDAGFEVRDVITHHFGTGFPKSLDVSKAIDKAAGAEREVIGMRTDGVGNTDASIHKLEGFAASRTKTFTETAPATDAAKQWQGWGTALKPASEHWILIRRPLDKATVAANVLEYGTGALNIDGARIGTTDVWKASGQRSAVSNALQGGVDGSLNVSVSSTHPEGRWPANLILSHSDDCGDECAAGCPVGELDRQSGNRPAGGSLTGNEPSTPATNVYAGGYGRQKSESYADSGGASRFFYVAKASTSERNAGLGDSKNAHPTVKALALMRYLVRLITPPGGTVLDPFMGSGSTGVAALQEGFDFIGIEREQEYFNTAKARILACRNELQAAIKESA